MIKYTIVFTRLCCGWFGGFPHDMRFFFEAVLLRHQTLTVWVSAFVMCLDHFDVMLIWPMNFLAFIRHPFKDFIESKAFMVCKKQTNNVFKPHVLQPDTAFPNQYGPTQPRTGQVAAPVTAVRLTAIRLLGWISRRNQEQIPSEKGRPGFNPLVWRRTGSHIRLKITKHRADPRSGLL